jgi:hypothetical protein
MGHVPLRNRSMRMSKDSTMTTSRARPCALGGISNGILLCLLQEQVQMLQKTVRLHKIARKEKRWVIFITGVCSGIEWKYG